MADQAAKKSTKKAVEAQKEACATIGTVRNDQGQEAPQDVSPVDEVTLWQKLLQRIAQEKPSLTGVLNKCRPGPLEDRRLNLEVGGTEFTLRSVKKNIAVLERLSGEIAGQELKLNVIPKIEDAGTKRKAKKKNEQLKQKALSHPMVMEVLELFEGKLVDIVIPQTKRID